MRKKGLTRNAAGASVTGGTLALTITGAPQVAAAHYGLPDFPCSSSYPGMVTRLELSCHTCLNAVRTHTY